MPEPSTNEVAIYPCRDPETRLWYCDVTFTETGARWFKSEPRRLRAAAISNAREQLADRARVMKAGAR